MAREQHKLDNAPDSTLIRTVTRGGAEVAFPAEQGGLSAAYLVRWVSATGEPGPWGETVAATVAA